MFFNKYTYFFIQCISNGNRQICFIITVLAGGWKKDGGRKPTYVDQQFIIHTSGYDKLKDRLLGCLDASSYARKHRAVIKKVLLVFYYYFLYQSYLILLLMHQLVEFVFYTRSNEGISSSYNKKKNCAILLYV